MATYTKNYNLIKPAPEDFGDVADLNANADKVDEVLKKKADLDAGGKLPAEQLPTLSYIPTSEKGKAGGVASLGQDGKVPAGQLPSLDYIPNNQKGQPDGVASLGSDGKSLLGSCLPWTTFPPRRRAQRMALRLSTGTERFRLRRFLRSTIFLQARKVSRAVWPRLALTARFLSRSSARLACLRRSLLLFRVGARSPVKVALRR